MSRGFYVGRAALRFGKSLHEFLDIQINLLSDLPKLSIITLLSHRSHGILQSFPKVLAHDLLDKQCAFKPTVFSYPVEWHYSKEEWGKGSEKTLVQSHPILSDPWTGGCQLPCPSVSPEVCSNSRALSWWCHPTISSSVVPFSSCPQSLPTSGSFPMSQLFPSGGQILELQHQPFQWIFRVDLLEDWLI